MKNKSEVKAMKNVLLSADGLPSVYSVPDIVANNLMRYCSDFSKWLRNSPRAAEYRKDFGVTYNESDFIKYLNRWIFPNHPSVLVETLDWATIDDAMNKRGSLRLPEKYKDCEWFNF